MYNDYEVNIAVVNVKTLKDKQFKIVGVLFDIILFF